METEKPSSKQAMALAFAVAKRKQPKTESAEPAADDGTGSGYGGKTCYACGGVVAEGMSEGGIAGEGLEEGELENAPDIEVPGAEDGGDDRNGFLRAYLTNRRLRGQA